MAVTGIPVVVRPSGGLAVTVSSTGRGILLTPSATGMPVTIVGNYGIAIVGLGGSDTPPNYAMLALPGSFALSGETLTPITGYLMTSGAGTFALAGQNATLTPPTVVTTTWNPADVGPLVLSNGNLTAQKDISDGGLPTGVRATTSHSTGKYFFSGIRNFTGTYWFGITNSAQLLNGSGNPTTDDNTVIATGGTIYNNGGAGSYDVVVSATDVMDIAVDLTAKLIWVRTSPAAGPAGRWNASGTADPATGVGGVSISKLSSGPWFAVIFINSGGGFNWTANFGPSYTIAKPAGYLDW